MIKIICPHCEREIDCLYFSEPATHYGTAYFNDNEKEVKEALEGSERNLSQILDWDESDSDYSGDISYVCPMCDTSIINPRDCINITNDENEEEKEIEKIEIHDGLEESFNRSVQLIKEIMVYKCEKCDESIIEEATHIMPKEKKEKIKCSSCKRIMKLIK